MQLTYRESPLLFVRKNLRRIVTPMRKYMENLGPFEEINDALHRDVYIYSINYHHEDMSYESFFCLENKTI